MIKKLFTALYADNNILSFNEYSGDVIISYNEMGILSLLTLMILIMMKITLELLFMSDFWLGIANLNNGTWYPLRWWDWCLPEDERKKKNQCLLSNTFCTHH